MIASLIIAFVFGFDDKREVFVLSLWLLNYVRLFFLAMVILGIYEIAHKYMAYKHGCSTEYKIWTLEGVRLRKKTALCGFDYPPLGIILPIVITLLSVGKFFFAIVVMSLLSANRHHRLGRRLINLTEKEEARIAAFGIFAVLILAYIFKILSLTSNNTFIEASVISSIIAVYHIIPFPNLDGIKILVGNQLLFVLIAIFAVLTLILISSLNFGATLILALLLSLIVLFIYFYFIFYK